MRVNAEVVDRSQSGRLRLLLASTLFNGREDVLLLSNVKTSFLPRVLKMEWPEIVAQTPFSRSNHGHQTKVFKLFRRIHRAVFA